MGLGRRRYAVLGAVCFACGGSAAPPVAMPASPVAPEAPAADALPVDPLKMPESFAPTSWQLLGPFENRAPTEGKVRQGMAQDLLTSLGGEASAVITPASSVAHAGKTRGVKAASADKMGIVDLIPLYQGESDMKVAYAYGEVTAAAPMRALALFGSDDAAAVWVNGKEAHRAMVDRAVNPNDDRFEVPLVQGKNRILVKVDNAGGGWGFALRLYDEAGKRQLEALELRRHLEQIDVVPEERSFFIKNIFPALTFVHPRGAEKVLSAPKVRWFDPALAEVTAPGRDGRYVALVEATTKDGRAYRRLLTFAKVEAQNILPWVPYEPWGTPPVIELPWGRELSRAEHQELSREMWRATQDSFWQKESGAVVTLALSELDPKRPKNQALAWHESGLVKDIQGKLDVRMKVEGRKPKPFPPPAVLKEPAGELRAGGEAQAGMKPGTVNQLRAFFNDWAKADKHGFVVVLARKGVVFMHEAFNGFQKDSLFRPASIAKTMTGLTFARAVDQGLIGFDQPLSTVFPAYAEGKTKDVTFRHCFYHLTGLTDHHSHFGLLNPYLDNDFLIQDFPFAEPGTRFIYNGDALNLASTALTLVTGRTMFSLYHEQMQAPFGEPVVQFDSGSGTRFSAMYLAKVCQMMLQDGKYGKHQLFSPGFLEKEVMPKNASQYAPKLDDKQLESGIGLGWMTDPDGPREKAVLGPNVVGHGAASGIFWRVALDHELVIVVGRSEFVNWQPNEEWGDRLAAKVAENIVREKR